MGAEHVQLSKILQRALLSEASNLADSNPTEAAKLRTRQQELASSLAARMTRGGQFIRSAMVLDSSAEDVMATAAKVAKERGKKLTPEEAERVHRAGEELEQASASLEVSAREVADKRREAEGVEEARKRAEEGALTKREIEALRKRLANLREKEKRREQKISDLDTQIPRKPRKPPVRKVPREIAADALAEQEAQLIADLARTFGMSPLKMAMAWHGSPHLFDRFRLDETTVGTGEGAQAYGHGLYFTDKKEIAEHYKKNLTASRPTLKDGTELQGGIASPDTPGKRRAEILLAPTTDKADALARIEGGRDYLGPEGYRLAKRMVETGEVVWPEKKGAVYKVDLAPEESDYLLWDKPLSQQSEKVKAALKDYEPKYDLKDEGDGWYGIRETVGPSTDTIETMQGRARAEKRLAELQRGGRRELTGQIAYGITSKARGGDAAASEHLKSLGIRGVKYKDNTSRSRLEHVPMSPERRAEVLDRLEALQRREIPAARQARDADTLARLHEEHDALSLEWTRANVEPHTHNYVIFDDADVTIQEVLKMARAEGETGPKAQTPQTALDQPTLEKLARLEALKLLRAKPGTLTVSDFKRDMVRDFGERVRPHVDSVHAEAVKIAREEVRKAHHEKTLQSIAAREGNEDLTREELEEIAAEEKEARRRAALVQREHERVAREQGKPPKVEGPPHGPRLSDAKKEGPSLSEGQGRREGPRVTEAPAFGPRLSEGLKSGPKRTIPDALAQAIARNAKSDEEAAAAAKILAGVADKEAVRLGGPVLETARREVRDAHQLAAALKGVNAQTEKEVDAALAALIQSRRAKARAQRRVAAELERIKKGKVETAARKAFAATKGVPIAMMAGGDMSPLLRQGGTVIAMQPSLAPDFAKSLFANVSDAGHARRITNMERDADFPLAQAAGVDFAIAGKTDGGDEFFEGAEILERIPVLRTYVRKSDQVFGGSLDGVRLGLFKILADDLRGGATNWGREPVTFRERPQAFKDVARFVNIASGRADKGPHNSALTQAYLNLGRAIGFAPGYRVSRFQFLTLPLNRSFWHADPAARRVVYKNYLRWLGAQGAVQGTLYGLGWITGGMVAAYFDPDDDDFLKVKVGNLRLDLTGGLQVPARFIGRMALEAYRGLSGEVTPGMAGGKAAEAGVRFMQTGLDPRLSLAVDWAMGETVTRKPFSWFGDYGVDGAIGTRMLPIGVTSTVETARKEDGVYAAAQAGAEFFGAGAQVYPDRADEPKTKAEKLATRFANKDMKGGKARTEEVRRKLDELKGRARKGEDVRAEVEPLVESGEITEGHGESIIKAKGQTLLQEKIRQLSLEDARHVLKFATPAEVESVRDILRAKALNEAEKKDREEKRRANPAKAEAERRKSERAKERQKRRQEVRYGREVSP